MDTVKKDPKTCPHEAFSAQVNVDRIAEKDGGPITNYMACVQVHCQDCGARFRFIGLPAGLDFNGATVSADAAEARLAILPAGQVVSVVEGAPQGFSIRRVK